MRRHPEHVHTPDDGRGYRDVTFNGEPLRHCIFADTRKGKVVVMDTPIRVHKHGKRIIRRTMYGTVTVTPRTA